MNKQNKKYEQVKLHQSQILKETEDSIFIKVGKNTAFWINKKFFEVRELEELNTKHISTEYYVNLYPDWKYGVYYSFYKQDEKKWESEKITTLGMLLIALLNEYNPEIMRFIKKIEIQPKNVQGKI